MNLEVKEALNNYMTELNTESWYGLMRKSNEFSGRKEIVCEKCNNKYRWKFTGLSSDFKPGCKKCKQEAAQVLSREEKNIIDMFNRS